MHFFAFFLLVEIGFLFVLPFITAVYAGEWASHRRWTNYPNVNRLVIFLATIGIWLLIYAIVGSLNGPGYTFTILILPVDPWYTLARGAARVSIGTISLALMTGVVVATIWLTCLIGKWLTTPRE